MLRKKRMLFLILSLQYSTKLYLLFLSLTLSKKKSDASVLIAKRPETMVLVALFIVQQRHEIEVCCPTSEPFELHATPLLKFFAHPYPFIQPEKPRILKHACTVL